jgi:putative hydrolase of the HAD superfamily
MERAEAVMPGVEAILFDAGDTLIAYRRPLRILLQDFFIQHDEIVRRDAIGEALEAVDPRYRALIHRVRSVEEERRMWLEVGRDLLDVLLPRRRDLYVALGEWFAEGWRQMKVFRDVRPAMRALRGAGYRLAVVSNWEPSLEQTLDRLGIRHYFEAVVTSSVEGIWKPDPALFRLALDRLQTPAETTVSIGDHLERDFASARHAGLQAVLLDRFNDHPEIQPRVRTLSELPALLPPRVPQPQ